MSKSSAIAIATSILTGSMAIIGPAQATSAGNPLHAKAASTAVPRDVHPDNTFACYAPAGTHQFCKNNVKVPAGQSIGVYIKDLGGDSAINVKIRTEDSTEVSGWIDKNGGSHDDMWRNNSGDDAWVSTFFASTGFWGGQTVTGHFYFK